MNLKIAVACTILCALGYGFTSLSSHAQEPNLQYDHLLLFTQSEELKNQLDQIFTPAEKLTTTHENQGTEGFYYLFYNTYIELLFLKDSNRVKENSNRFGSEYLLRWKTEENHCPIGIGMTMNPWPEEIQSNQFHKYQSKDAPEGEYYLMSESNRLISEPLIYVSQPHRAYESIESLEELNTRPKEIRADLLQYLSHSCKAKKLTNVLYSYPTKALHDGNTALLAKSEGVEIKKAKNYMITLVFDEGETGEKVFQVNDHTMLRIKY